MKARILATLPALAALCLLSVSLDAASFTQAKITRLEKDVKILKENAAPHAAVVGENVTAVTSVATGANSRAELKFPDNSLTRLGANSRFTIRGQGHTVDLDKGVLLFEVPEKLRDAKVRTAAVTAAVTGGTVIVEFLPGGFVKLMVIEGKVDMFLNNDPSQFATLNAGEMIIQPVNATTMNPKVAFDLKLLLKTSKLINADTEPNAKEIQEALNTQQNEINDGELVKTNLVIPGLGTMVQLTNDARLDVFNNFGVRDGTPPPPPGGNNNNNNTANGNPISTFQGVVPLIAGLTVLNGNSYVKTDPQVTAFNVATGTVITSDGSIYRPATDGPFPYFTFGSTQPGDSDLTSLLESKPEWATYKFEELLINGTPDFDLPGINYGESSGQFTSFLIEIPEVGNPIPNVIFAALNGIALAAINPPSVGPESPGATTGSLLDTSNISLESLVLFSQNGDITLAENFQIRASEQDIAIVTASASANITLNGDVQIYNGSLLVSAGQDLLVQSNVQAGDVVFRAGRDATIKGNDGHSVQASNQKLLVSAKRNIKVTDSAQLLLLSEFSADALLRLESLEGEIVIDGGSNIEGTNVEIEAFKGNVSILDSTVTAAHALKVQTLRPDGTLLIRGSNLTGGSSSSDPADLIRLYANGSNGTVQFEGLVKLDSDEVQIAGKTVKVGTGGVVTITKNNVHIFADNRLYNKNNDGSSPGNGTINSTYIKDDYGFGHSSKPDFKTGGKLGRGALP